MNVPATAPLFDDETRAAVDAILRSGWLTEGEQCEAFTAELLAYMQAPYGCLVSNGTVALKLGMMAVSRDEQEHVREHFAERIALYVATPTLTFAATANAAIDAGLWPLLMDGGPVTQAGHENGCTYSVPVWLFGNPPQANWLTAAASYGPVIEDAAQAIGCWHDGQHAGTFGNVGCFSFYADKTITTGEGGLVVCKDEGIYKRLEELRNHGRPKGARGYVHEAFGINARMTEMQAAIGRCQLRHLEEWRQRRLAHWHHYAHEIGRLTAIQSVHPVADGCVPFRFVAMVPDPQPLVDCLQARGVAARRMFLPLHRQSFLKEFARGQYPHADRMYEHGILLPVHQGLSDDQIGYVCECVREFYHGR